MKCLAPGRWFVWTDPADPSCSSANHCKLVEDHFYQQKIKLSCSLSDPAEAHGQNSVIESN